MRLRHTRALALLLSLLVGWPSAATGQTAPVVAALTAVHVDARVRPLPGSSVAPEIRIPRATDAVISLTVKTSAGAVQDISGAVLVLSVRQKLTDGAALISRLGTLTGPTTGVAQFSLGQPDTDLAPGPYLYSVEVTWSGGAREQLVKVSPFTILQSAGTPGAVVDACAATSPVGYGFPGVASGDVGKFLTLTDDVPITFGWADAGGLNSVTCTTPLVCPTTSGAAAFSHAASGVTAGTKGSASAVPVFDVNGTGHITDSTNTPIAIASSQVISGTLACGLFPVLAGDLSSSAGSCSTTVVGLQGSVVSNAAPSASDFLQFVAGAWTPAALDADLIAYGNLSSVGFVKHTGAGTAVIVADPLTEEHGGTYPNAPDTTIADLILWAGQSLATGYGGDGALTTTAPAGTRCRMMNGGINMISWSSPNATVRAHASLTTLIEGSVDAVETGMAAHCNAVSLAQPGRLLIGASAAVVGTAIATRIKGTSIGDATRAIVGYARTLALAESGVSRMRVPYVFWVDGESDDFGGANYYNRLVQEQIDLQADIQAITGQAEPVIFVLSQPPGTTGAVYDTCQAQVDAVNNFPTKFALATAKFPYEGSDVYHLANRGYRAMGSGFARAHIGLANTGSYSPLRPVSVTRVGADIYLKVAAETYPIHLFDDLVSVPSTGNYGFEYFDDGTPPAISNVWPVAYDTLRVHLASTPSGANKRLRFAHSVDAVRAAGPAITGRRGTVHDSTQPEANYLNSFSMAAN